MEKGGRILVGRWAILAVVLICVVALAAIFVSYEYWANSLTSRQPYENLAVDASVSSNTADLLITVSNTGPNMANISSVLFDDKLVSSQSISVGGGLRSNADGTYSLPSRASGTMIVDRTDLGPLTSGASYNVTLTTAHGDSYLAKVTWRSSAVSISLVKSDINSTTLYYDNGTVSFSTSEKFTFSVSAQSVSNVHLSVVGASDGMWAKLMPENLTSVGPAGTSSSLVIAGAVIPGGGRPSDEFTLSVVATDDAGHTSAADIELVPVVGMAVIHSPTEIVLRTAVGAAIDVFNVSDQVVPCGAVYDPPTPDYALRPLLMNMSVAFSPLGILVNGTVEPLPSWLQVVIPEPSFNLTADAPHYFELGVKLVSAPLGNFTIAVGETIGGENFVAYVNYTVFPQPHT